MRAFALLLALSPAAAAQVTGEVRYQDRAYDGNGFTGQQPYLPVRYAEVEIVRESNGQVLGTGVTGADGCFSIGGISGGIRVFARVYARRTNGGINAVVRDNLSDNAVYTARTETITTGPGGSGAIARLDLTVASGAAPPFNIFDVAVKSFEYEARIDPNSPAIPPQMVIYWEAASRDGTYFSPTYDAIFLLGTSSDPDEYDDDIILHEIGHWVAHHFSKDDSLGGLHTIVDQIDPRTSWSEGFAHYWSAAVRRAFPLEYARPHYIVDNRAAGAFSFEIEGPSFPDLAVMATNELAVAAVLWDITDEGNEGGFDPLSGNEGEVWGAVKVRIPTRDNITLEDFRDGLALEKPSIMLNVTGSESDIRIMNDRLILYYPNAGEPNDSAASAVQLAPGGPGISRRTIYPSGDADWYSVDISEGMFQAETFNLGDGANTILELYDEDGATLLAANDDRGQGDPSSLIAYPIRRAGLYYLRVTRSGTVVENGYYDIHAEITGPIPAPDPHHAGFCAASIASAEPVTGWTMMPVIILSFPAFLGIRAGKRAAAATTRRRLWGRRRTSRDA